MVLRVVLIGASYRRQSCARPYGEVTKLQPAASEPVVSGYAFASFFVVVAALAAFDVCLVGCMAARESVTW
ncbi:hypothetical protein JOD60_001049 [Microbacterium aurum]|nr:hypothetical protein [Microbacterium aurum]